MSVVDNIKINLANKSNYGNRRSTSSIKYLVIHYTANDGDTDENNGKYFKNNVVKSSAHYFVDDDSITRSVPDDYVAYHCGAKSYKHKTCRNANSIGIEICDDVKNGVIYPSQKTIENVIELTKSLMEKYNIPAENVIRHYDVTGKLCPAYWVDDAKWKSEFWNKINGDDDMTKEEVIKIIQEYEAARNKKPTSNYAKESWSKAKSKKILDGTAPQGNITREQIATVLNRLGLLD